MGIIKTIHLQCAIINGASYLECYKHFKMFLPTSLKSHVTVTGMYFLAGSSSFYQNINVSWGDLDYQTIDTPPGMLTIYIGNQMISSAIWNK